MEINQVTGDSAMKTSVTDAMKLHIAARTHTLATCVKITRTDGNVFGFTDHDENITYDGVVYYAAYGCIPSAVSGSVNLNVDNLSVDGLFNAAGITKAGIIAGLWDHAEIQVFLINYRDTTIGIIPLPGSGWLGEKTVKDGNYTFEFRSKAQALQQSIGRLYTSACSWKLGDADCGVTLATYQKAGAAVVVTDNANFTATVAGGSATDQFYRYGILTWTSGSNDGLSMEVKSAAYAAGTYTIQLVLSMPYTIVATNAFTITPGCDKAFATCKDKYSNSVNFGGFPHIPGRDVINQYPDSVS